MCGSNSSLYGRKRTPLAELGLQFCGRNSTMGLRLSELVLCVLRKKIEDNIDVLVIHHAEDDV